MKAFFKSKKFKWSLGIIGLTLFLFFHFIGPRMIVARRSLKVYPPISNFNIKVDTIELKSKDGLKLSGLYVKSNLDTTYAAIVYIHGIGGMKDHYLAKAEEMANQGYAAMLVDLRGHGNSEGDYMTFGYNEVDDVKRFTKAAKLKEPYSKLGIWGQSLGGSIALQMLAADTLIDFGIVESTYSTFDDVVYAYSKRIFKINLGWFNDYVIWRAQSVASFDKSKVHPIDACKNINQAVLLVHGSQDDRISIDYAEANFAAIKSNNKEFITVKGANHINVWKVGGADYKNIVLNFIKKNQ